MNIIKLDVDLIKKILPVRNPEGHKGTFGTALLLTGSYSMAGAGIFSAKAANRCGCGLVKHVLPESIYNILASNVPESVYYTVLDSFDGNISADSIPFILEKSSEADAILIGCGSKNNNHTFEIVKKLILSSKIPLVIDADGINALSTCIEFLQKSNAPIVLTPHLKEFSRITGLSIDEILENRYIVSADFAKKYNCYLVLKGHETLITTPYGEQFVNTTGNSGMAKGGSGDVLAGMIVSLIAQKVSISEALCIAVFIHGLSGDISAFKKTEYCMTANDIIENLGDAFQKVIKG